MKGGDMKHMEMMLERQKLDEAKKHFHTGGEETLSAVS